MSYHWPRLADHTSPSRPWPPGLAAQASLSPTHWPGLINAGLPSWHHHPGPHRPGPRRPGPQRPGLLITILVVLASSSWPHCPGLVVPASPPRPRHPGLAIPASPPRPRRAGLVVPASFSRPCHPALILLAWSSQHCCAGPQRRLTPNTYAGSLPPYGPPRPMRLRHKSPNPPTLPSAKPHEDGRCADRLKGPRWHCSWQGRRRIQDKNKQQTL